MPKRLLPLLFLLVLLFPSIAPDSAAQVMLATSSQSSSSSSVMFIENVGQFADDARFQVWGGPTGTMWLANDAIWLTVVEPRSEALLSSADPQVRFDPRSANTERETVPQKAANIKLSFVGANLHSRIEPFDRLDTVVSYFIGNEPDKWRPDVPVWGGVRYVDLYPGVDLEITSEGGQMVQRLAARPGVDLSAVRLRVEGVDAVTVDGNTLRLSAAAGEAILPLLQAAGTSNEAAAQSNNDQTFDVTTPFTSTHVSPQSTMPETAGHAVANLQAPIDNPADLLYGTFLGGSHGDQGRGIAVDTAGCAYVTGVASSNNFPTTPGAFDTNYPGGYYTAFVVKLNPDGSALAYATFLGGGSGEDGYGIAVDGAGNAYVTGIAYSSDFPATLGAFDTSYNGNPDAFVAKLYPAGSGLTYATFLGGSSSEIGYAIAVDEANNAYVTGVTASNDFPTTPGAFDTSRNSRDGTWDTFVVKLNPTGSALAYSTFLGGNDYDFGYAIAVDGAGSAYVTGNTRSSDFPTTPGAFHRGYNLGYEDAFVAKLNLDGSTLAYATFLGGSSANLGYGIAVDGAGSAYVTGVTASNDFPTTPGAFDTSYNYHDAFVVKLNTAGSALTYATFLGGNGSDWGYAIAVDGADSAYVTGATESNDFPTTPGAFDTSHNGGYGDAFVTKLNAAGSGLDYSAFLGGSSTDQGNAIAVDRAGRAYVTGGTYSGDFPTTPGAFDLSYNGASGTYPAGDAFVVKLAMGPALPVDAAELASQVEYLTVAPGAPVNFWIDVRNTGKTTWRASDGYGWRGDDQWLEDSGPVTGETPPGAVWRRETTFTAPTTPGEYVYGFMMRHGTQEFGPYFFIKVTVVSPKWTLMYYLAGDNDLDQQASDMNRLLLETQARSTGLANVVVAIDGMAPGDSAYDAYTPLQSSHIPKGELNMGDPRTLADFVNWAKTAFPADYYALIVFDHGNGVGGVAGDRGSSLPLIWEERLTPKDLGSAIPSKVDVIVMRACLMGMIEIAYELQGKADFYVASETTQYGTDANGPGDIATVISTITDTTTPRQLAQLFFDKYRYGALNKRAGDISILSMAEIPNLVSKVKVLAQALLDAMNTEESVLSIVSQSAQRINMTESDLKLDSADEYVDLRDFAQLIEENTNQPEVRSAAGAVKYAVDQGVKDHYQHGGFEMLEIAPNTWISGTLYYTNTNGISIWFPSQRRSFFTDAWSSWASGITSWNSQFHAAVSSKNETAELPNPWVQMLINYTARTNPIDNPNPPALLPVYPTGRPQQVYLPLIIR